MSVTGSIRKVTLNGITFDAMADANFSEIGSQFENEAVPTSGRNLRKMTRRAKNVESVVLACDGSEREIISNLADQVDDFPMSYETASGDVYRATGWIEFENRETEEGRATIQMHPRNNEWQPFLVN